MEVGVVDVFVTFVAALSSFILGYSISRYTLSKMKRLQQKNEHLSTAQELLVAENKAFEEFTVALAHYSRRKGTADMNDFFSISTKGELYFNRVSLACDAILAKSVSEDAARVSIFPKVKEVVERSLPDFYSTLREISPGKDIQYTGVLRREDYESIYSVYETLSP